MTVAEAMLAIVLLDHALRYWRTLDEVGQQAFRFLHVSTDEVYGSLGDTGLFDSRGFPGGSGGDSGTGGDPGG